MNKKLKLKAEKALKRAVKLAGGPTKVANYFTIKPPAICQWVICPAERVLGLVKMTKGLISAAELRPDLYPKDFRAGD